MINTFVLLAKLVRSNHQRMLKMDLQNFWYAVLCLLLLWPLVDNMRVHYIWHVPWLKISFQDPVGGYAMKIK